MTRTELIARLRSYDYDVPGANVIMRNAAAMLEADERDAARYRWLVANAAGWSYQPSRYNSTTVSGFAANGTGYLGYTFEQGLELAMKGCQSTTYPPTAPAHPTCTWTEDADGYYSTECGEAYVFNDGTPAHNNAYFCHHCGRTIVMGAPL